MEKEAMQKWLEEQLAKATEEQIRKIFIVAVQILK
jgi:hypothetical protein